MLAPVVAGVATVLWFFGTLFFVGLSVSDGGPVGISINVQGFYLNIPPKRLFMQMAVGFAVGLEACIDVLCLGIKW